MDTLDNPRPKRARVHREFALGMVTGDLALALLRCGRSADTYRDEPQHEKNRYYKVSPKKVLSIEKAETVSAQKRNVSEPSPMVSQLHQSDCRTVRVRSSASAR